MTKYPFDKQYDLLAMIGDEVMPVTINYSPNEDYSENEWNKLTDLEKEETLFEKSYQRFKEITTHTFKYW
jgi:hypothetical protein